MALFSRIAAPHDFQNALLQPTCPLKGQKSIAVTTPLVGRRDIALGFEPNVGEDCPKPLFLAETLTRQALHIRLIGLLALILIVPLLAACDSGSDAPPSTPTEVAIVRRLATIPPTPTRDPNAPVNQPTPVPSIAPPPTSTPYVGQFLGEAAPGSDILGVQGGNSNSGQLPPVQIIVGDASTCEIAIDPVFGERWQTESRATNGLGCPIQAMFGFEAQVQVFQDGIIYARSNTNEVWAINPGGLNIVGLHWNVSQLPLITAAGLIPPAGLIAPSNEAIAAVWVGVPDVRDSLGWATDNTQTVGVNIQRFNGGTLFLDVSTAQVFALLVNGDAYGPYQGLPSLPEDQ